MTTYAVPETTYPNETKIDVVQILDKVIDSYEYLDRQIYKPLASTIHNYVEFSPHMGTTGVSNVGLWFLNTFGLPNDMTVDAETYLSRAVDPTLGHELHTLLLLLNNEYDQALKFDGRFDEKHRIELKETLPRKFDHSVFNDWPEFDRHLQEVVTIREIIHRSL